MSFVEGKLVRQRSEPVPEHLSALEESENLESNSLDGRRINVLFRVINQNDDHFKRSFKPSYAIGDVKRKLAKLLKTRHDNLTIIKGESQLGDESKLCAVMADRVDEVELDILTKDDSFIDVDIVKEKFNESISVIVQDEPPKRIVPANITCKFHVIDQEHSFTKSFASSSTVAEVRDSLYSLLAVERDNLVLMKSQTVLGETLLLSELAIDNFGNLDIELYARDGAKMKFDTVYKDVPISDILTVAIPIGVNKTITVNVEVIDAKIVKPYLGGYRNKITGLEYHHAFTQTQSFRSKVPVERKNSRDTQTFEIKEKSVSTAISRGTQSQKLPMYFPQLTDVVLVARPYKPYSVVRQDQTVLNDAASRIQRSWRAYIIRKNVAKWLIQCRQRIQDIKDEELEGMRIRELHAQKEMRAKVFPRTKEDFEQLYAMVDRWRNSEVARISKLHPKAPKVAEFCLLLDKEIQLLRSIEKCRIELAEDYKKIKEKKLLEEMSKPVTWHDMKGNLITMDTLEAQKARQFKDIYLKFCDYSLSADERMELLVNFKFTLSQPNHKCATADQLVKLIDRECEMLVRNVPVGELEMLRKRIDSTLFQFIKSVESNRDMIDKFEAKKAKKMENGRLHRCKQCDAVKQHDEFPLHSRVRAVDVCASCNWNNFSDKNWVDMTPYNLILRALRREEQRHKCWSSVGFVVRERDVHFIVEKIWHSRSAISEARDLIDLRLSRWRCHEEWSPWNCVLLTYKEMKSHAKLEDPEGVYDEETVRQVHNKHALARLHFKHLANVCSFEADAEY